MYGRAISPAVCAFESDAVDKLNPVTKMDTNMQGAVPQDKIQSAGYAELLFAYEQLLFVFLRKAIFQAATVGGDLAAAALKWAFEEGLRSNGFGST